MSEAFTDYFRHCVHHLFGAARHFSLLSLWPVAALAVTLPLLTGCGDDRHDPPAPPRPVRYLVVAPDAAAPASVRTGEIRAHDETTLSFRTDGRVVSRLVDIGAVVHAGQLLATLERATGENQAASAQADRLSAQAAERVAALNLKRMQALMPSGAIARSQLDSARADWQSAVARLKSSEAALRNAQENLSWTRLIAPADGVVTGVSASAGQVVSAGQGVFTLATSDARDVVFDVSDPQLFADQTPTAFPVSLPQTRARGVVVPASALTRQNGRAAVFVIDAHQQAQPRPVTIAAYTATAVILAGGVSPGDRVITAGVSKLRPGEKVIPGETTP
ncbi:efflux RND transporter periplasmic adaptor subunit [Cronobacter muytjensii]|uniref:Efflux RND transporter periplasmic adaptor subunit n=1 Tax=Cronobacter muytjensii TaxID=413501 RepID=A0A2T7AWS6_9ENTR|nr:efflux RND transporter periplasmic adaptor subunit [Cronobacter muytjensii]KAB0884759.1 efflux RND transporter periplasmic adaptor subunit [Cronobacter muytjensii]MBF4810864.1 efflux RND transporter periplasmic adaptor subunit [Cronobacter muytjensii]PUX16683.1 efflux RND transporter periplasmic adaptor subunit [Cronobacter muytjensii]